MSISNYSSTKIWQEKLEHQKPHMTVQNYLWALQVFCEWVKKNPDELILERSNEISNGTYAKFDVSEIPCKRIVDFQSKNRSLTKHSKAMIVKALTSFYESNLAT